MTIQIKHVLPDGRAFAVVDGRVIEARSLAELDIRLDAENWKTINGAHVLLDRRGNIIAGAGGAFAGMRFGYRFRKPVVVRGRKVYQPYRKTGRASEELTARRKARKAEQEAMAARRAKAAARRKAKADPVTRMRRLEAIDKRLKEQWDGLYDKHKELLEKKESIKEKLAGFPDEREEKQFRAELKTIDAESKENLKRMKVLGWRILNVGNAMDKTRPAAEKLDMRRRSRTEPAMRVKRIEELRKRAKRRYDDADAAVTKNLNDLAKTNDKIKSIEDATFGIDPPPELDALYKKRHELANDIRDGIARMRPLGERADRLERARKKAEKDFKQKQPVGYALYKKPGLEKVRKLDVKRLEKPLSSDEIIQKVGGGDETEGSCASLTLAYAANRMGMDVRDYRDGDSREWFAASGLRQLMKAVSPGCKRKVRKRSAAEDSMPMLEKMAVGKEYIFVVGRHAAITRKTADGKLQYLELQAGEESGSWNGWHDIEGAWMLNTRFKAYKGDGEALLMDIDKFRKHEKEFEEVMTHINTEPGQEAKGPGGHER